MSGKRQHFIPQFLQRGFASHTVRDETFTWVYRKDVEPFNSNIKNIGVEGFFYSDGVDKKIDELITESEPEFNDIVIALRDGNYSSYGSTESIAKLIAHFEVRTRHLRRNFFATGRSVLDQLLRFMDDREIFCNCLIRRMRNNPDILSKIILKECQLAGFPPPIVSYLMANAQLLFEQSMQHTKDIILPLFISHFRSQLPSKMNEVAKSAHLRGLNETIAPEVKIGIYMTLHYNVITVENIILGDSIVVFQIDAGRKYKPFLEKDDKLIAIYLPLAPNRILIGSTDDYKLDLPMFPKAIAQCSLEYFIASEKNEINDQLRSDIGINSHMLSEIEIETMITELMNE